MRIHENPIVEQMAVETIASLQLGMDVIVLEAVREAYEETENFEECLGITLGIDLYNTKNFGCKIKSISYEE